MNIKALARELQRIESRTHDSVFRELRKQIIKEPLFKIRKVSIEYDSIYFSGSEVITKKGYEHRYAAMAKSMGGKLIKGADMTFFIDFSDLVISFQPNGADTNGDWNWIAKVEVEE